MNKTVGKAIIVATVGNILFSSVLFLQLKELENRFVVLHDDFNMVTPKFSKDIWELNERIKK